MLPGSQDASVVTVRACALAALTSYAQSPVLSGPIKQTTMKSKIQVYLFIMSTLGIGTNIGGPGSLSLIHQSIFTHLTGVLDLNRVQEVLTKVWSSLSLTHYVLAIVSPAR